MASEIELYVFRNGRWEMFNIFSKSNVDRAVEEAISLKDQNAFRKIAVLEEAASRVHYYHDVDGRRLQYDQIKKALETSNRPQTSRSPAKPPAKKEDTKKASKGTSASSVQEQKETEPVNLGLSSIVLISGFLMALFIMFSMQFSIGSIIFGALFAGACAYYSHILKQPLPEEMKKKEAPETAKVQLDDDPNYATPEQLEEAHKIFEHIKQAAVESSFWNKATEKMGKDNHFGLILFALGALQAVAMKHNKNASLYYRALSFSFKALHLDESSIIRVAENMNEFRLNMRYAGMFDRGYSSTQSFLKSNAKSIKVAESLTLWQQAEEIEEETTNAVLFTDIVGFTKQTAEKGEDWLRTIVHAHNRIVRDVLKQYDGKEIKHTGDGIMATFPKPLDALNASVNMQKGFQYFSQVKEDFAFAVRIGIASGTPVQMDGDIFGNPVNMAARVMDFGNGLDITLSEEAYKICVADEGCKYSFKEEPNVEIKGFEGEHNIFKVVWLATTEETTPTEDTTNEEEAAEPTIENGADKAE